VSREGKGAAAAALAGVAVLVAILFALLFSFRRLGPLDFWWGMALNIALAGGLGFAADRGYAARLQADLSEDLARKAGCGLLSAVLLYGLFAVGKLAALRIFPFAASGIASVYGLKAGTDTARIVLLMGLVIGPGEEIVWRGFLQENLGRRYGRGTGFVLTAVAYALVHASSGNTMLVLAAGVCGVFWGVTYLVFRSPVLNIVSHTAWDLLIFIVLPV
jgi:membrane protease YdiL (CAAX protease family)